MSPNTSFRSTAATVMQAAPATQEDDSDPEHAFIFNDETNPCVASSSLNTTNYSANINTVRVWDVLHHRVARHAILNTGGWGGDAKCHPGTREEVVTIVERWMDDPDGLSRIMWLNGPAGAGKTAIMRTIADRSKDRGAHTANFFFSREDTTRNHVQPVVVTLLYQISQLFPSAHDAVATVPYSDPLILEASIRQQFNQLLHPLFDVIQKSSSTGTRIVLIIDAFDECDIDAEHNQAQLLYALDRLVTQENSSVLVLVSSRLEAHIQMAFHRLSSRVQSISLDGQYSPDKDIRRFVTAEFRKIKSSHPSAHLLTHDWPAISDIESIVTRSAGQFLYAATVMRFFANSSIVPSHSLGEILAISPLTPNSPFAHLDALYVHILSMMGDHEATRDILSAWEFHERHFNYAEKYTATTIQRFLRHYNPGYTDEFFESWLSDLAAIVQDCNGKLVFYHASLSDFLRDKSRSNEFYIDLDAFCAKVFPAMWRKCVGSLSFSQAHPVGFGLLHYIQKTTPAITDALLDVHPSQLMSNYRLGWDMTSFVLDISRLYYPGDAKAYKQIVKKWIIWSLRQDRIDVEHFDDFCEPLIDSFIFPSSSEDGEQQHKPTIPFGKWYLLQAKFQKRLQSLLEKLPRQAVSK